MTARACLGRPGLLAVVMLLGSAPAAATDLDFWETASNPELPRYRRELRAGLTLFEAAGGEDVGQARQNVLLRGAIVHFERAVAAVPDGVEAHYHLGSALFALKDDEGAVASFERVLTIDPTSIFEAEAAFKLGVSRTRQQRFEEAVVAYDRALASALSERPTRSMSMRSVSLSNRAEVQMGLGRLDEAITSYRMAFDADDRNMGALWGLAVALDRDEQVGPARETAARAVQLDPAHLGITDDDVFFVPEHERHYYLGLAFEAAEVLAVARGEAEEAAQARASALGAWRAFLEATGQQGRWALQAQRHVPDLTHPAHRRRTRRP